MSINAPWLALSCDWWQSEMFDDSSASTRLAWVCLLCHVKAQGRAGRAKLRVKTFAAMYTLSVRSVEDMIQRAQKCDAIEYDGNVVTLCNWRVYQQKHWDANRSKTGESSKPKKSQQPSTKHQAPSTVLAADAEPRAPAKRPRPPNPLWDAVAEAWFGGSVKKPDETRVGRIVSGLKDHGAQPQEVPIRRQRIIDRWGPEADTPESLLKHWAEMAKGTATPASKAGQAADRRIEQQRKREAEMRATAAANPDEWRSGVEEMRKAAKR